MERKINKLVVPCRLYSVWGPIEKVEGSTLENIWANEIEPCFKISN